MQNYTVSYVTSGLNEFLYGHSSPRHHTMATADCTGFTTPPYNTVATTDCTGFKTPPHNISDSRLDWIQDTTTQHYGDCRLHWLQDTTIQHYGDCRRAGRLHWLQSLTHITNGYRRLRCNQPPQYQGRLTAGRSNKLYLIARPFISFQPSS